MREEKEKKLFIVVNVDWFFLSHRLPIAIKALSEGYKVTIIAKDSGMAHFITEKGLGFINLPFSRSGVTIFKELKSIFWLYKIYIKQKPDIVHHVTLKISVYGSIAAHYAKVKRIVNAISGLGYNFTSHRNTLIKRILEILMRIGFGRGKVYYIFQNKDDLKYFSEKGFLAKAHSSVIKGSGVDLEKFEYTPEMCTEKLKVLFPARMLFDKGLIEFVNAANILYNKFKGRAEFILAGSLDFENPAAIREKELNDLLIPNFLIWVGNRNDILNFYKESSIVVLPSYREGLPKSLIEACAIGRPIVTTDAVGCRECVCDNLNGFLVPIKDEIRLAEKIEILLFDSDLRKKMGLASRKLAEKEFSIKTVIDKTLNIYEEMMRM